jgi:hypothetical protein
MLLNELHLKKYKYIQLYIDFLLYVIKACAGLTGLEGSGRGGSRFASPLCAQQCDLISVRTGTSARKNWKIGLQHRYELIRIYIWWPYNLINSLFLKLHTLLLVLSLLLLLLLFLLLLCGLSMILKESILCKDVKDEGLMVNWKGFRRFSRKSEKCYETFQSRHLVS